MKHTIRFLAVALCLLFARDVGARTLYVDARRPNNNGNGLSEKKAKKTIQAAINIAKKGDTIIVYPGKYDRVETNNKKIKIKSKSGAARTTVHAWLNFGASRSGTGKNTKLVGVRVDGDEFIGSGRVSGGIITACVFDGCWGEYSTFNRCKFTEGGRGFSESKFTNCLFEHNYHLRLTYSTLVNCTIAGNSDVELAFVKAYNTVFHWVPASQFQKSQYNKLKNCYKGENPGFVSTPTRVLQKGLDSWYWQVSGIGDYRLKKGSPCINKGKLTAAQKKLVGTNDLAGKKRVKGKSVDIGCYEY